MMRGNAVATNPDEIVTGGIPLVFFKSEERLNEILRVLRRDRRLHREPAHGAP